ncbi:MAG: hypothetical protein DRQ62_03445 [Gammaproteobacteria bacterium]|nr:MAG: hypothetical protein DRQ62_03445 [Gammaproteobacteria bacterium]
MQSSRKYRFICILYLWFLSAIWSSCCLASEETSERLYVQGLVPFSQGDYITALKRFQKAANEPQPYGLAVYYLGLTFGKLGEYEKAIPHFNKALILLAREPIDKKGFLSAHWDMATAYYHLKRYTEGLAILKKAEEIDPDNGLTYYYQGLFYSSLNDYDAAIQSLNRAAELDTGILAQQADYHRSHVHLAKGEVDSAIEALQGIVAAAPDTKLAKNASDRISQLSAQIQRKKPEKPWEIRFGVGGGYDSNVILEPNGAPSAGQITGEQDSGATLELGGTVDFWRRPSSYFTGNYDFYQSLHGTLKDYDVQAHHAQLTAGWSPDPALNLGLQGGMNYYLLGNDKYLLEFSAMPFMGFFIQPDFYTQILYQFTSQDYLSPVFDKIRDGIRQEVSIREYFLMDQFDSYISLGYRYDMEDPDSDAGDDFQYHGHSVELSIIIPTLWETNLELGYNFHKRNYTFPNSRSNFTTARDDSEHDFLVILSKPLPFLENYDTYMEANISYRGTINNSNINIYEYDRNVVTVNLEFVY